MVNYCFNRILEPLTFDFSLNPGNARIRSLYLGTVNQPFLPNHAGEGTTQKCCRSWHGNGRVSGRIHAQERSSREIRRGSFRKGTNFRIRDVARAN